MKFETRFISRCSTKNVHRIIQFNQKGLNHIYLNLEQKQKMSLKNTFLS